jgi:ElaB/YqjD/DUF883 family membrane-anchored ribosome-binding protein
MPDATASAPTVPSDVSPEVLTDKAKAIAGDVSARAQDTYDQVRRAMIDGSETARDWAADQSDVLRDTVQTKPFISIGVSAASAFAAGLILGVLLTRR